MALCFHAPLYVRRSHTHLSSRERRLVTICNTLTIPRKETGYRCVAN